MVNVINSSNTPPEKWPKYFLVFSINQRNGLGADVNMVTANEDQYTDAQDFAEKWFADPAILRIYELNQMFGIGRFRG